LPQAKVQAFSAGQPITVSVSDLEGGDLYHSHFTKLKHLNEFKKNLSNGKTFRMTAAKVKDLTDAVSGGSILGSIIRGLSSAGKALSIALQSMHIVAASVLGWLQTWRVAPWVVVLSRTVKRLINASSQTLQLEND
jgi:hypothetical protein